MCAHAVRVAIKKIDGVEEVEVSLNRGTVDIRLEPNNRVTVEKVREIIRSNGFTPKEGDVEVAGKVIERGGAPALEVSDLKLVYLLRDPAGEKGQTEKLKEMLGQEVVIRGAVPEDIDDKKPRLLIVRSISAAETSPKGAGSEEP